MSTERSRGAAASRYFFDTYALVELANGNSRFAPYAGLPIFTHQFNVFEFVSAGLRQRAESHVREQVRDMRPNLLDAETDDLFAAARFRMDRTRSRVSYVDALGYVLARRQGMRFLTGDRQFKGEENVEYVA